MILALASATWLVPACDGTDGTAAKNPAPSGIFGGTGGGAGLGVPDAVSLSGTAGFTSGGTAGSTGVTPSECESTPPGKLASPHCF